MLRQGAPVANGLQAAAHQHLHHVAPIPRAAPDVVDGAGGIPGQRVVETDVGGQVLRDIEPPVDAQPGQNLVLTIDTRLQQAASTILQEEIADWNARNSPSAPELVSVLGGLFDAVTHLHSLKPPVIHRDIEPSNILLTARLSTYLVDFGQAKRFQPPNVFLSEGVLTDQRTDQYSLAATIYTLLIGFPPPDSMQRLESETAIPSISASRPDVSSRMEQAVIKALSLKPSDRHMDVQAFRRSLGR